MNKMPVGDTELSRDAQQLKKIRIEPTKPDQGNKSDKSDKANDGTPIRGTFLDFWSEGYLIFQRNDRFRLVSSD